MQDSSTGDLSKLREQAEQSAVNKNGKWYVNRTIQGLDINKSYDSKEEAVDAAFDALKQSQQPQKK